MELYTPIHNTIIFIKITAFNFYYMIEAFDYFTLYLENSFSKMYFSRQYIKREKMFAFIYIIINAIYVKRLTFQIYTYAHLTNIKL